MYVEVVISAIAAYIVWRQETIEREINHIDERLDKLERLFPKRKTDV